MTRPAVEPEGHEPNLQPTVTESPVTESPVTEPTKPKPSDTTNPAHAGLLVLVASITALFGLLTTIGISGDHVSRLYRNYEDWAFAFFGLITLGVAITLMSPLVGSKLGKWLTAIGILIFFGGVFLVIAGGVKAVGTTNRPEIEARLDTTGSLPIIRAVVRYEGLKSTQRVSLEVVGGLPEIGSTNTETRLRSVTLFQTELGPDASGNLNRTFEVPVAVATLSRFFVITRSAADAATNAQADKPTVDQGLCAQLSKANLQNELASCVEVAVPPFLRGPDISASWNDDASLLNVVVRDPELPLTQAVAVKVRGRLGNDDVSPAMVLFDGILVRSP
jgi:hypothetical protein